MNSLRAFEAMARSGRATLAGAELGVTHSAVSRQVKSLEARLGVRLFEGPRHALALTPAGRKFADALTPPFSAMASAVRNVRLQTDTLAVAVNLSLASKWLIGRLPDFHKRHPAVRLELVELPAHATAHGAADGALRLVAADPGHAGSTSLVANRIGPVAAPHLGKTTGATRLTSRTHPTGWSDWAARAGAAIPDSAERAFSHLHQAEEAAVAGLGVAVLPWLIVADDVAAGRLRPVGRFVADGGVLALLADNGDDRPPLRAFRRWVATAAQRTDAECDQAAASG